MYILRVALDVPVATLFDYRANGATPADAGCRVIVPFGRKTRVGVVVEVARTSTVAPERLKSVQRIMREAPAFSASDLELLRFAADYYHHPLGAVVMAALPAPLRRLASPSSQNADARFVLTSAGAAALEKLPPGASAQRKVLRALQHGALAAAAIRELTPRAAALIRRLTANGWIERDASADQRAPDVTPSLPGPELTSEQARAANEIRAALGAFRPILLLGITGSGKTEVYLQAVAAARDAGRQALLLVPEISLTPQLEGVIRARFPGATVVSLHSGLSGGERLANWQAAQSGLAHIVLGTRLAVFTPMPGLGVIIVDEEHDASFKQAEGFRYSARDLAVVRARLNAVPVVLASATPALESYYNATNGRYRLLTLTRRIGAEPPRIEQLDTRGEKLVDGLSPRLVAAIEEHIARGEQSLVFINRRGYAPVLMCHGCGWISGCHRCSAQLVLHLTERRLRCHHCGHQRDVPAQCPGCGSPQLAPLGQGTQRVEAALVHRFPAARIARIDRDSVRPRQAWPEMRRRIERREIDLLVGTQLLAKGHDFPHLNLVGVVNADSLLYSTDFRSPERLYALLTQVAGRAGRGGAQGVVVIQTEFPDHPLYQALARHDYAAFAETLLAERREAGFPPFVYQALLRAEAPRLTTALAFLERAARIGRGLASGVTLYDPVSAAMPRRAGRERAQLLVQSRSRRRLQQFLGRWYRQLATERFSSARWALDVDPLEF